MWQSPTRVAASRGHPNPSTGSESGGWGLFLVDQIADRWDVEYTKSGSRVWFKIEYEAMTGGVPTPPPATLLAIGGLHVTWGPLGSPWPQNDRDRPSPRGCFAVTGLLGVATGLRPVALAYDQSSTPSRPAQPGVEPAPLA